MNLTSYKISLDKSPKQGYNKYVHKKKKESFGMKNLFRRAFGGGASV